MLRAVLCVVAVACALALVSAQGGTYVRPRTPPISDANTNPTVPTASQRVAGIDTGNDVLGLGLYGICGGTVARNTQRASLIAISAANNNNCQNPKYYISNLCDPSSALLLFPATRKYPGTQTDIPQNAFVCTLPTTAPLLAEAGGVAPVLNAPYLGRHNCIATEPGVCALFPNGPTLGVRANVADRWAIPRSTFIPAVGQAEIQYPRIARGTFNVFPLGGDDGTYVFPTDVPSIQPFSASATQFGTAQFDFKCRSAGPANSRAIICADGTNQNYFSAPLNFGFSPATRTAYTFMTYGRGLRRGLANNFLNRPNPLRDDVSLGMTAAHPEVYAQFTTFAAADNVPLPNEPQQVTQKVLPVWSFDAFHYPAPSFVRIGEATPGGADAVTNLIRQGVQRKKLINDKITNYRNSPPPAGSNRVQTEQQLAQLTFQSFYRGESIGVDAVTGNYFGGVYYATPTGTGVTAEGITISQIQDGYAKQPAWTGCFGPGPEVAVTVGTTEPRYVSSYLVNTVETIQRPEGFSDWRFYNNDGTQRTNAQGTSQVVLPSAPGLPLEGVYTCNDWTFYLDPPGATTQTFVFGVVGDPGIRFYTAGNPASLEATQPGEGSIPDQSFVYNWLSDNLKPQACNTPNQNVYCSWFPTNTDGVKNGDETAVDCGGTTLGADNEGRPTPNCQCGPGYFYDYQWALCIPCIQDTYCNEPTGCKNECYPCFTAPTSGAVLNNQNQAVWPNKYANPQVNNRNSLDQVPGTGAVTPQGAAPASSPYGASYNTNGQNVILVGTTFNQMTQRYDRAATFCYCNVGFAAAVTPQPTGTRASTSATLNANGVPVAGQPGTPLLSANSNFGPPFLNARGWQEGSNLRNVRADGGLENIGTGFRAQVGGPYDGSNCVPVVRGDPQITGLQGQDFQVHGIPDEIFNMVSHPDLQVNAHFVFLEEARCDNFTTCFSHAGTYIDQVGMQIGAQRVKVLAGSLEEGLRVFVDGQELAVGDKRQLKAGRVFFAQQRKVHIRTKLFSFAFVATDKFMNQEVALLDGKLAKLGAPEVTLAAGQQRPHSDIPLHGIVGQTWQNLRYPDGMMIEGAVADYRVEESDLFGNTFAFNQFTQQ